ncbi:MAG: hypothetical protein ACYTGG_12815 [Planctomycetota bacterium]|jgi:hypothetical protein
MSADPPDTPRTDDRPGPAPYHYEFQFDEAMSRAAAHLMRVEHRRLHFWFFAAVVGLIGLGALTWILFHRVALLLVPFYGLVLWYVWRQTRLVHRIVRERLCLKCGYRLLEIHTDERGRGICPECGRPFSEAEYIRPPKRLHPLRKTRS